MATKSSSDAARPTAATLDERLERSRLAALLAQLQSYDYLVESLSQYALGDGGGWALVAVLEAWKASCRLRFAGLLEPGRLMSSFASQEPQEEWSNVMRRLGAASPLRQRADERQQ